jgi:hypothetical protein
MTHKHPRRSKKLKATAATTADAVDVTAIADVTAISIAVPDIAVTVSSRSHIHPPPHLTTRLGVSLSLASPHCLNVYRTKTSVL